MFNCQRLYCSQFYANPRLNYYGPSACNRTLAHQQYIITRSNAMMPSLCICSKKICLSREPSAKYINHIFNCGTCCAPARYGSMTIIRCIITIYFAFKDVLGFKSRSIDYSNWKRRICKQTHFNDFRLCPSNCTSLSMLLIVMHRRQLDF